MLGRRSRALGCPKLLDGMLQTRRREGRSLVRHASTDKPCLVQRRLHTLQSGCFALLLKDRQDVLIRLGRRPVQVLVQEGADRIEICVAPHERLVTVIDVRYHIRLSFIHIGPVG